MKKSTLFLALIWLIIVAFLIVVSTGCTSYSCPTYASGEPIEIQAPVPMYTATFVAQTDTEVITPVLIDSNFDTERPSVGVAVKTMLNKQVPIPLMVLGASVAMAILDAITNK